MEIQEAENPQLKEKKIVYGIVLGVISVVLGFVSMLITKNSTSLMSGIFLGSLINYVPFLVAIAFFTISLRKINGGYWSFSTALKNIFVVLAITAVIGTVSSMLMNWAMPKFQEEVLDNTKNLTINYYEQLNVSEQQIDDIAAKFDEQREALGKLSIGQNIFGLFIYFLVYFVLALIYAAIFKKEKPLFRTPEVVDPSHPWKDEPEA